MKTVRETIRALRAEAAVTNERRLLVLHGDRDTCYREARRAVESVDFEGAVASVSDRDIVGERIGYDRTDALLGTTFDCIVLDCHDTCRPNAIGRTTGVVDGGGILVLLFSRLSEWPTTHGRFDETLASPPFSIEDVDSRFKRRMIDTLRAHRGIAIVDVDAGVRTKRGRIDQPPRRRSANIVPPVAHAFPDPVYEACRSADQRDAVYACEQLTEDGAAVVLEADRGRGKSSAAGLAAAALAAAGYTVLVTAPSYRNAAELFERAVETLRTLDALIKDGRDGQRTPYLRTDTGGIRFRTPSEAVVESADILIVDEAAALSVGRLEALVSVAPSACFATTVRGYEGSGRGFDIRFRSELQAVRNVTECVLSEPIRYAAADPIEVWLFRALLLDSTPPPEELVADSITDDVTYERIEQDALAVDDNLLREVFGLLVYAHYRTQPDDLARLLDAPNVAVRAFLRDGHPVSVALLAREGGLDDETRLTAYEGDRIRGNLIPDLLTSQLRDPEAGIPVGFRVLRIATHHAVRSEGFGSRLLAEIEAEFASDRSVMSDDDPDHDRFGTIDYLGVSYGATPELCSFWATNDYRTVHLSSTRNEASGEHSAVMLRPISELGRVLTERHTAWFYRRIPDVLSGALSSLDPDIVRGAFESVDIDTRPELNDFEWRLVASSAYGPGQYETAPGPFRRLALRALVDGALEDPDTERLLVVKVLQNRTWEESASILEFVSKRACMRAIGSAFRPIVDRYGEDVARAEADRYRSESELL
ncbi:tRNA(Met) cytidine acetyltransferase TmcA [Natronomonas sp.]|uniref:tRNA(Met) cytidine acetyltransferase TmcA n=1 Tax=Natronomonas sp. TaxID=2184060 RepID=UPI003976E88F